MNQTIPSTHRATLVFTTALAAVLIFSATGCKHKPNGPPSVTTAPRAAAPTTAEDRAADIARRRAELFDLPPLGTGVNYTDPNGEIWIRYPSGIMIHELHREDDEGPQLGQTISIAYIGTFPGSNKEFDRSPKDSPLTFRLGDKGIVKGLSMGISTMHIGGKRRIFIPPDLAYGAGGSLPKIPPDQALIFEVELLSVTGEPIPTTTPDIPDISPMGPNLPTTTMAPATEPAATSKP